MRGCCLVFALTLFLVTGAARAVAQGGRAGDIPAFSVGAAPAWVTESRVPGPGKPPPGTPVEGLLSDAQTKFEAERSHYYFRTVHRLLNAEGVRQFAEVSVVYQPEYQSVAWHTLRLIRDGQPIELLEKAVFRSLQREPQLEAQIFDGRITVHAVLEDVRPGDWLEAAYTLTDASPLTRGWHSSRHYLGGAAPLRLQSVQIRMPAEFPAPKWYYWVPPETQGLPDQLFRYSSLRSPLETEEVGGERIFRWRATDLPAVQYDPAISPAAAPYYPMIRCSSFGTWDDVAGWAAKLFEGCGPLPAELRDRVAQWKRDLPDPRARLRAAVDLVQGEIRYFAMALGDHNIRPRPLEQTWATRFGDCKDKSVLLVALLRELEIPAWAALVGTEGRHRLEHGGPDHRAFNHAIVAYEFEGRLRWVDPTLRQPAGTAGAWAVPSYHYGLLLRPNEFDLTPIPPPGRELPDMEVIDRITVDADSGTATMHSEIIYRALMADQARQSLDALPAAERSRMWFNFVSLFYRRMEEVAALSVEDDQASNQVIFRARYELPNFVRTEGDRSLTAVHAYALRTLVDQPQSRRRHWPFALPAHRFVRHRIELETPFDIGTDQRPQVIVAGGMNYRVEKSSRARQFIAVHDLEFLEDLVPAARMGSFSDAVEAVLEDLSTGLFGFSPPAPAQPLAAQR